MAMLSGSNPEQVEEIMKKRSLFRLAAVLMIGAVLFCLIGCGNRSDNNDRSMKSDESQNEAQDESDHEPQTGITRLNFVPAIGHYKVNTRQHYCFYIDTVKYWYEYRGEVSFMVDEDYDYSLLSSQSAMDFIKEVEAIPNDTTEADGPFALKIDMEYKDPDGTTHPIIKTMYGALPENWDTIVKLANELTMQRMEIPVSKKITVVNGNYLREYHHIQEDEYPHGVSLDSIIKELGITYEYLYDETLCFQNGHLDVWTLIGQYTFDYLGMKDYQFYETTQIEKSTEGELKEYAEKHLESITSMNDVSAVGKFRGNGFEIVRSDGFEKWRKDNGADIICSNDDSIGLIIYGNESGDETKSYKAFHCYIDPSHKYLIISPDTPGFAGHAAVNYNDVYDFFQQ